MAKHFFLNQVFENLNLSMLPDYEKHVRGFFGINSEILFEEAPYTKIYFTIRDAEILYKLHGMTEVEILNVIKSIPEVNPSWLVINTAQNIVLISLLRHYKAKRDVEKFNMTLMYFAVYHYAYLFNKYFKHGVKRECMAFTVNRLSQKFLIKSTGNVFKALEAITTTSNETYANLLVSNDDIDIINYVVNMRSRLNSLIQNIAREYFEDYNNKNFLNKSSDTSAEGIAITPTDISSQIESISNQAVQNLIVSDIDYKAANNASKICLISSTAIAQIVKDINHKDIEQISSVYKKILSLYFSSKHSEKEICSKLFFGTILEIYSKSFTNDENILELKKILDRLLEKHSIKFTSTNREATKGQYRKAVFIYYALQLQANVCGG